MTGGGLYDPLGTGVVAAGPRRRPSGKLITAGVVFAVLAIMGIAVALRGADERGEPHAVVTIERLPAQAPSTTSSVTTPAAAPASILPAPPVAAAQGSTGPAASGDADVEVQNGVRIIRMRPAPSRPSAPPIPPPPPSPATAAAPGRSVTKDATPR